MPQITLVSDQHNDNVRVGMVAKLFQPPCHILVCLMFRNIVNQQGTDSAAVVGRSDGSVSLLAGRIPNLGFDGLVVNLDAASGELDTNGGLAIQVEFVASESREQIRLPYARIADQDNLEKELPSWISRLADMWVR